MAEAEASSALKQKSRIRQTAKTRRSVCFVTALIDEAGRCVRMAEGLQATGYSVALYETAEFLRAPNPDFDAYIFHHPTVNHAQLRSVVTSLGNLRRTLISDWDLPLFCDEIFGSEQPAEQNGEPPLKTTDYIAGMKLFRRLSAATPPLAELASLYQPDVELMTVPDGISPRLKGLSDVLQLPVVPRNPKSLGFVANTPQAASDLALIYDVLFKIVSEDSACTLTIFGPLELPGPLLAHPRVKQEAPLSKLSPELDLTRVACIVDPHVDQKRDRCVSRIGFLQASLAGCQYVASPLPDLSGLDAPNLRLAAGQSEWHDQIQDALTSTKSLRAARSAASHAKKNHASATIMSQFQNFLA
ncbi:MAG: hypothetical protein AAGF81_01190 [Pseudomonadota bacterium]